MNDYANSSIDEFILWHDYPKHGVVLQKGDILLSVLTRETYDKWGVIDTKIYKICDEAMDDSKVYIHWKARECDSKVVP